jgi:ABC-type antimicrobial peptide transport system permease subunit
MIRHYLTVALRSLWKYRAHSLISMGGLSISIACFTLCFYIVRSYTGIDRTYPGAERMYTLMDTLHNYPTGEPLVGAFIQRDFPDVEKYTVAEFHRRLLFETGSSREHKYMLNMMEVMPSFFDFFSIAFLDGSAPNPEGRINLIVLCESTARRLFGTVHAVGETLTAPREYYDMEENKRVTKDYVYTVAGVIPDFPGSTYFNIQAGGFIDALFVNDERGNLNPANKSGWSAANTIVMLRKGVDVDEFNAKFTDYAEDITAQFFRPGTRYFLHPFSGTLQRQMGTTFYVIISFFGLIGLLLLLASVFNYTSYTVNLFMNKRHECAIRKTAGGQRRHLFFLFYTETGVTILLSGLLALQWTDLLLPTVHRMAGAMFTVDVAVLRLHLLQYTVAGLILSALMCLIPVGRINQKVVRETLYGGKSRHPKSRLRHILLGLQLFISIFFISGTLIMYLQLGHLASITVSTLSQAEKEYIFEVKTDHSLLQPHVNDLVAQFKTNPDIEEILLMGTDLVAMGGTMTGLKYNDEWIDFENMNMMSTGENYASFTRTRLIAGRYMQPGRDEMVINEAAQKMLGGKNMLGEIITNYNRSFTVVGVMENTLNINGRSEIKATFFMPCTNIRSIYVRVNPVATAKMRDYILQTVREYLPETIDYRLYTLGENISSINRFEDTLFRLIGLFSLISIIISLSGVYSSVLLATERRRKEVAIRKINGAMLGDIIRLFLRTYIYTLIIAAIPAFVLVHFLTGQWLASYIYRITVSWLLYALLLLALALLLTLTVIYRLAKTAAINPAETVKSE